MPTTESALKISEVLKEQGKYPSLNGLRGISIILVVVFHLYLSDNAVYASIFNGGLGVCIFFVLSGFLITSLCLKEKYTTGNLSLKNFYIRRVIRIFPVAYLYILVVFILNRQFNLNIFPIQFLGAMTYLMNLSYFRDHHFTTFLSHYWSLSVEEQFYIIFPFLIKKNIKLFTYSIVFIAFLLPLICLAQAFFKPLNHGFLYLFTHYFIKFQSIAVGCLFAILAYRGVFDNYFKWYRLLGNILALVLIFYLGYNESYSIKSVYINLVISLLTAYIITSNIVPSDNIIYKALNFKPLAFIGILSYSIYIWQQLFTSHDPKLGLLTARPYNLIFIIVVPCVSYFCYERYFLSLKARFSKLKSKKLPEDIS